MRRINLTKVCKALCCLLLPLVLLSGCGPHKTHAQQSVSLPVARTGFKTTIVPQKEQQDPVDVPPSQIFRAVSYPALTGAWAAYLTPDPGDGKRHPAIIWITGGDCNSIGDVWSAKPRANDQTARAFREAGIIMMFPSLRGGNANGGIKEGFFGEVDDILAAESYLQTQKYVDTNRIYLGGHSTGGTLELLVAECSSSFRAVFSFGPIDDVTGYGRNSEFLPFDVSNSQESLLRSPGYWLSSIQSPVWVFEGAEGHSNIEPLRIMAADSTNPKLHFIAVKGADHFTILAPTTELIAQKILQDTGQVSSLSFTEEEVNKNFTR
jgi:hypothetical protein